MKEEWLQNDFSNIEKDIYDSIYLKSKIIAIQKRNKYSYNLSTYDIVNSDMLLFDKTSIEVLNESLK